MSERDEPGSPKPRSDERLRLELPAKEITRPPASRGLPRTSPWRVLLAAVLLGVIGFLALRTSPYLQYIAWMPRGVGVWADSNGILRNVVAFLALGFAVFFLVGRGWRTVLALATFATGVEVAQRWIPGRVFDWRDIAASVAGVLLAWLAAWPFRRRREET